MPEPSGHCSSGQGSIQRGGWLAGANMLAWGWGPGGTLEGEPLLEGTTSLSWLEYFVITVTVLSRSSDSGTDTIKPIFNSH